MTYRDKYEKLVETIYKELAYSQRKINDKNTPPEFANFQSGKKLALEGLIYTIKQMESAK